jgi:uncharacterized protein YjbI with pentapeptide repeats
MRKYLTVPQPGWDCALLSNSSDCICPSADPRNRARREAWNLTVRHSLEQGANRTVAGKAIYRVLTQWLMLCLIEKRLGYNGRMEIKDREGRVIHKGDTSNRFCDLDLRNGVFEGMVLQGAHFDDSNLAGANFRGADLYWGNFFLANLAEADLEGVQLQGADLKEANLTNANLRNANLGRDNVGGSTQLQGAVLTGANLEGTKLDGAEYDAATMFPEGFDPIVRKMIFRA